MSAAGAVLMDHEHGAINNRCSHPDCAAAYARYAKRYQVDRARGVARTADGQVARDHLVKLEGAGWSRRAVAGASGISPAAISRIGNGQRTVRVGVLRKLLALDPNSLPLEPGGNSAYVFVPRIGTVRRIQALLALGWTHGHISEAAGVKTPVLLTQVGRWVSRPTHDKIAAAYRELSGRPGPSNRTRGRAAKLGYLTPAAWDDIDLDVEPDSASEAAALDVAVDVALDEVAVLRRLEGDRSVPLSQGERREVVRRLHARGLQDPEIEQHAGIATRQVLRDRQALGLAANESADQHPVPSTYFDPRYRKQRKGEAA